METTTKKSGFTMQTLKNWLFGSGEFGRYSVQALAITYAVYYFTTVYGISAGVTGTIVLIARIIAAAWNFIFGILIDRVNTKQGRARPFILFIPIAITFFLMAMYSVPFADGTAKIIWAAVMYTAVCICTNMLAVAYSVLVNLCAKKTEDRLTLGNSRMFFTVATYIIFNGGMLMFVEILGKDNPIAGFRWVALIACVCTIILNTIVFFITKELPSETKPADKSIWQQFKDQVKLLFTDSYTAKFLLSYFVYYIYITLQYSACVYFFLFKVNRPELIGTFFFATNFVVYACIPFMRSMIKKLGTRNLGIIFCLIGVAAEIVRALTGDSSLILFFIMVFVVSLSENLYILIFPVMVSDCSDYAKYRYGKTATGGIVGAAYTMAALASAIGGAILPYILQWAGYTKEMKEATPKLIVGIDISFIFIPLACWAIIALIFYSWKKQNNELDNFRANDPEYKALA